MPSASVLLHFVRGSKSHPYSLPTHECVLKVVCSRVDCTRDS